MITAGTLRNLLSASRTFLRSKSASGCTDIQMSGLWASVHSGQRDLDAMTGLALEPIETETRTEAPHNANPNRIARKQ